MNLSALKNRLFKQKNYCGIKSFTYFLPAPPVRKSGYQEKEFDLIFSHLLQMGYDLLDIKMQSISGENSNGVWIVCVLGAKTAEALERNINIEYQEIAAGIQSHIKMDPLIEHEN